MQEYGGSGICKRCCQDVAKKIDGDRLIIEVRRKLILKDALKEANKEKFCVKKYVKVTNNINIALVHAQSAYYCREIQNMIVSTETLQI